jgi:hypothetical protein
LQTYRRVCNALRSCSFLNMNAVYLGGGCCCLPFHRS